MKFNPLFIIYRFKAYGEKWVWFSDLAASKTLESVKTSLTSLKFFYRPVLFMHVNSNIFCFYSIIFLIKKVNHYECIIRIFVMLCAIWYQLYNLKNVKNTHGEVLLFVKLQAFNTPLWEFSTFFKLYKWYQIEQRITSAFLRSLFRTQPNI